LIDFLMLDSGDRIGNRALLNLAGGKTILDIGCADGDLGFFLSISLAISQATRAGPRHRASVLQEKLT